MNESERHATITPQQDGRMMVEINLPGYSPHCVIIADDADIARAYMDALSVDEARRKWKGIKI